MSYEGTVRNGVIVPDNGAELPEGTIVRFEAVATSEAQVAPSQRSFVDEILAIAQTLPDLPPDFAEQHEHYTHGRPKR